MSDPFKYCSDITKKSASNLWFVSRSLSPAKHKLFVASYASMRVIDDFVDNDFLTLDYKTRQRTCEKSLAKIKKWQDNSVSSAQNCYLNEASDYPEIFFALNHTLGKSSLGDGPWVRLAKAMQQDIAEKPLNNWDDFLAYCVGATIAPAEVFLYVLSCDVDDNGNYSTDATLDFQDLAREMAIFCYLVHIMRDIAKDGQQGGQLVTIPTDMLAKCGLTRDGLVSCTETDKLEKLIFMLVDKTSELLPALNRKERFLKAKLHRREKLILSTLLSIYRRLFDNIKADPQKFISGNLQDLDAVRQNIAKEKKLTEEGA